MIRVPHLIIAAMASLPLTGCGSNTRPTLDPSRDLDCSVVSFYFAGFAKHVGAPAEQTRAAWVVSEWFHARLREDLAKQGQDGSGALASAEPLLEEIKRDPKAATDEFASCSNRAIADPGFDAFARKLARDPER